MNNAASSLLTQAPSDGSNAALIAFALYILAVLALAALSGRLLRTKEFLNEYFLGSRSLGVWAFALTFAATSASGGSFMGFPAKIYTHGWVLALWIGSYMLVPVFTMGLLGKRLNQLARQTGAITIPDLLDERFESAKFGMLATLLIIFFMAFNLVAQFKAGALMLSTLFDDVPLFQSARAGVGSVIENSFVLSAVEPGYLLCLLGFALVVILYTTYGGFRAVVWSDMLQGVVMLLGVLILLPLTLWYVGGLGRATDELATMTPPRMRTAHIKKAPPPITDLNIPFGAWIETPATLNQPRRIFRIAKHAVIRAGDTLARRADEAAGATEIPVLEITTPAEVSRIEATPLAIGLRLEVIASDDYTSGAGEPGVYVTGPGPSDADPGGFLPLSLAVSFFFMWTFAGAGVPPNMVRLMAFNNSRTFSRAIFTVSIYYTLIYFPLVIIFCCARLILPGMEIEADRIMPALAEHLTAAAGWPWLAGLLVAAPFAAVMSTVDSFLLMVSSSVVRDVYQKHINPNASERTIRRLTYAVTLLVGIAALLGALNPPRYLQDIIVYTGSGLAGCFLAPMALALYWPRINTAGAAAGMIVGFLVHLSLYVIGFAIHHRFQPIRILNFDTILPAICASLLAAILFTYITPPPPTRLVKKFFHKHTTTP